MEYKNRREEFFGLTVGEILSIIEEQKLVIKDCDQKLIILKSEAYVDMELYQKIKAEKVEADNKRIRAYSRLRKLGYKAKEIRSQKAQEKKNL